MLTNYITVLWWRWGELNSRYSVVELLAHHPNTVFPVIPTVGWRTTPRLLAAGQLRDAHRLRSPLGCGRAAGCQQLIVLVV
jgi:hypothetical protein